MQSKLLELCEKYVPTKNVKGKPVWKKKGDIPVGKNVRIAKRQKHAAHRRWMRNINQSSMSADTLLAYIKARKEVKRMIRQAKRNYKKMIAQNSKEKPKLFWSHVRGKLKTKSGVAPLLEDP